MRQLGLWMVFFSVLFLAACNSPEPEIANEDATVEEQIQQLIEEYEEPTQEERYARIRKPTSGIVPVRYVYTNALEFLEVSDEQLANAEQALANAFFLNTRVMDGFVAVEGDVFHLPNYALARFSPVWISAKDSDDNEVLRVSLTNGRLSDREQEEGIQAKFWDNRIDDKIFVTTPKGKSSGMQATGKIEYTVPILTQTLSLDAGQVGIGIGDENFSVALLYCEKDVVGIEIAPVYRYDDIHIRFYDESGRQLKSRAALNGDLDRMAFDMKSPLQAKGFNSASRRLHRVYGQPIRVSVIRITERTTRSTEITAIQANTEDGRPVSIPEYARFVPPAKSPEYKDVRDEPLDSLISGHGTYYQKSPLQSESSMRFELALPPFDNSGLAGVELSAIQFSNSTTSGLKPKREELRLSPFDWPQYWAFLPGMSEEEETQGSTYKVSGTVRINYPVTFMPREFMAPGGNDGHWEVLIDENAVRIGEHTPGDQRFEVSFGFSPVTGDTPTAFALDASGRRLQPMDFFQTISENDRKYRIHYFWGRVEKFVFFEPKDWKLVERTLDLEYPVAD